MGGRWYLPLAVALLFGCSDQNRGECDDSKVNYCLSGFKPRNYASPRYNQALTCIEEFILSDCQNSPKYQNSLDVLTENIFTKNVTARDKIRSILHRKGVINYSAQMDQLVEKAEEADLLINESKRGPYLSYLTSLKEQAEATIYLALALREKPRQINLASLDKEISKGVKQSRETLNLLLELDLTEGNWSVRYKSFMKWKKSQSKVYDHLLLTLGKGLSFGKEALEEWQNISYLNTKGEWEHGYATVQFKREWGEKGEKFYSKKKKIEDIIKKHTKYHYKEVKLENGSSFFVLENIKSDL